MSPRPLCALTIAGSDSGGGAGIQADLKTFAAHRVHGLSAVAVLTAQNTQCVSAVHVPPLAFLRAQLDALFLDFEIGAVKLGMLANEQVIETVAELLEHHAAPIVVLDPVMIASSGARLLEPTALSALRRRLLPLSTLLTPNIPEAELLLGHAIESEAAAASAVDELLALGSPAVLLKGGHLQGAGELVDRFGQGESRAEFRHARLELEGHGTGCTLASAIAAQLCRGMPLLEACRLSADYVHGALRHASYPGRSRLAVLDHFWALTDGCACAPLSIKPEIAP